jgi:hypothetical protein
MASVAHPIGGGPEWACLGPRLWAATEKESAAAVNIYLGLRSGAPPARPPDAADLAVYGARELAEVMRSYGRFFRRAPELVVEMHEATRGPEMTLKDLDDWKSMLTEKSVFPGPVAVFSAALVAAYTRFSAKQSVTEAVLIGASGMTLALALWVVLASTMAKKTPRWARRGWELE